MRGFCRGRNSLLAKLQSRNRPVALMLPGDFSFLLADLPAFRLETPPLAHTFARTERLKSRKVIGALFQQGGAAKSFLAYPLRVVFVLAPTQPSPWGEGFPESVLTAASEDSPIVKSLPEGEGFSENVLTVTESLPANNSKAAKPSPQGEGWVGASPLQVAFSVSKRSFKKAVTRNRIKRLMREAYRLHKHELATRLGAEHPAVALMLIYVAKEELPYSEVEAGMRKLIRKWPETTPPPPVTESGGTL